MPRIRFAVALCTVSLAAIGTRAVQEPAAGNADRQGGASPGRGRGTARRPAGRCGANRGAGRAGA